MNVPQMNLLQPCRSPGESNPKCFLAERASKLNPRSQALTPRCTPGPIGSCSPQRRTGAAPVSIFPHQLKSPQPCILPGESNPKYFRAMLASNLKASWPARDPRCAPNSTRLCSRPRGTGVPPVSIFPPPQHRMMRPMGTHDPLPQRAVLKAENDVSPVLRNRSSSESPLKSAYARAFATT